MSQDAEGWSHGTTERNMYNYILVFDHDTAQSKLHILKYRQAATTNV